MGVGLCNWSAPGPHTARFPRAENHHCSRLSRLCTLLSFRSRLACGYVCHGLHWQSTNTLYCTLATSKTQVLYAYWEWSHSLLILCICPKEATPQLTFIYLIQKPRIGDDLVAILKTLGKLRQVTKQDPQTLGFRGLQSGTIKNTR